MADRFGFAKVALVFSVRAIFKDASGRNAKDCDAEDGFSRSSDKVCIEDDAAVGASGETSASSVFPSGTAIGLASTAFESLAMEVSDFAIAIASEVISGCSDLFSTLVIGSALGGVIS